MFDSKQPKGRIFYALHELFPGIPDECFSLHSSLKLHGGSTSTGDVVSFVYNGILEVGELKLTVGINRGNETVLQAVISKWDFLGDSADRSLRNLAVRDNLVIVHASRMDCIFTHRMSDTGDSCGILVPLELRDCRAWVDR